MLQQQVKIPEIFKLQKIKKEKLKRTNSKEQYNIKTQQQFATYYKDDPFFKAKIDFKLQEIQKRFKSKNRKMTPITTPIEYKVEDAQNLKVENLTDFNQMQKQYWYLKNLIQKITHL